MHIPLVPGGPWGPFGAWSRLGACLARGPRVCPSVSVGVSGCWSRARLLSRWRLSLRSLPFEGAQGRGRRPVAQSGSAPADWLEVRDDHLQPQSRRWARTAATAPNGEDERLCCGYLMMPDTTIVAQLRLSLSPPPSQSKRGSLSLSDGELDEHIGRWLRIFSPPPSPPPPWRLPGPHLHLHLLPTSATHRGSHLGRRRQPRIVLSGRGTKAHGELLICAPPPTEVGVAACSHRARSRAIPPRRGSHNSISPFPSLGSESRGPAMGLPAEPIAGRTMYPATLGSRKAPVAGHGTSWGPHLGDRIWRPCHPRTEAQDLAALRELQCRTIPIAGPGPPSPVGLFPFPSTGLSLPVWRSLARSPFSRAGRREQWPSSPADHRNCLRGSAL